MTTLESQQEVITNLIIEKQKLEKERDRNMDDLATLKRERDEAREALENYKAESIHTCHDQCQRPMCVLRRERDDALSQIVKAECRAERFCQERDETIENLDEEKKFHHRTHSELVKTQCKVLDLTQAIIATLEENRHLADGDDCTLAKLKSVVPDWK